MAQLIHKKVEEALSAVGSFCAVLKDETAALKASNIPLFEALQDEKLRRAKNYQDAVLAFEEHVDLLQNLDEPLKDKLRQAHIVFTATAEENQSTLLATSKVSERIVNLIMGAARKTVDTGPSYSALGRQNLSDKIPVHFKLNEVL